MLRQNAVCLLTKMWSDSFIMDERESHLRGEQHFPTLFHLVLK